MSRTETSARGLSLRERLDLRRFFRGDRPRPGPITLDHQRIFILPNRRGLGFALLLVVQWLTAINYENNLAFLLTFLLVAVALVGILDGYRNLAGLQLQPRPSPPVFAGTQAAYEVVLRNSTAAPRHAIWLKTARASPVRVDVPAADGTTATLGLPAAHRGWLQPGTLTVFSEYPLGLFHAWSPLNFTERILVYPRPAAEPLPLPPPIGAGTDRHGRDPQSTDEFSGFKRYESGDPTRHIHWKGIAKGQPPQIRRYTGEQGNELVLNLTETPGTDLEGRLSRLCRWILDAEAEGFRYGLSLPGIEIPPQRGSAHCHRCLSALATFR